MITKMPVLVLWLFVLMVSVHLKAQYTFPCDGAFYLVNYTNTGSQLERLVFDFGNKKMESTQIPISEPSRKLTCLGYNVVDQYLYALDFETYELLKIDNRGRVEALGVPLNLNTKLQYYAGHVIPYGRTLMVIGRDPVSQEDKIIYNINIQQAPYLASSQTLITDLPVQLSDLSTHPFLGVAYGFDAKAKRLVSVGGGLVSTINHPITSDFFNALYFDKTSTLYGYGNSVRDGGAQTHYLINRHTGKTQNLGKGYFGRDSDGCSCPYYLDFAMKITPAEVLPCSEITIEYTFFNAMGANWQNLAFRDSLPLGVTIKSIEKNSANLSTIISGVGTNLFQLENMNLILESNTIRLKAWVDDLAPGRYAAQAMLRFLPGIYGKPALSDNLETDFKGDSTYFKVVDPESIKLSSNLRFSCDGDTAYVEAPLSALTYEWSDGSTGKTLVTTKDGQYTLLAKTPCLDYRDTLMIDKKTAPLSVRLQAPARLESGEQYDLKFAHTGGKTITALWSASPGLRLSCAECTSPNLSGLQTGSVHLELRDERGCTARDSARIEIIPQRNVYIPNSFSPDGDSKNDHFYIQGRDGAQIVRWRIYDRWGNLVFEQKNIPINDPSLGWDGTCRALNCTAGVFRYELEIAFPDGIRRSFPGVVNLLR